MKSRKLVIVLHDRRQPVSLPRWLFMPMSRVWEMLMAWVMG
jgi:hypothetical protein